MTKKPTPHASATTTALLGRRVRTLRLECRMGTTELDRHIDARPGTIAGIESGKRPLFAGELYRLSLAMGVPVAAFFPDDAPAAEAQTANPAAVAPEEARAFAAAYQNLKDPKIRRQISALTKAVAARKGRP